MLCLGVDVAGQEFRKKMGVLQLWVLLLQLAQDLQRGKGGGVRDIRNKLDGGSNDGDLL